MAISGSCIYGSPTSGRLLPDLIPDIARRQGFDGTRLVPDSGETGHALFVVGQNPFRYAFHQVPESRIPRYPGSPDGELSAPIDSLVVNSNDHTLWINTDGETAWTNLAGSAGTPSDSLYGDASHSVGTSTGALLSFVLLDGPALLDLSTATIPTAVDAGFYVFTVTATTGDTLDGWGLRLTVRDGTAGQRIAYSEPLETTTLGTTYGTVSLGVAMAPGDDVRLDVENLDGAVTATFSV